MKPSREEFHALAREHSVVPVWRELLADYITPVAAFDRLVGGEDSGFLLESVEHGERWSRWSFVGRRPLATLTSSGSAVTTSGDLPPDVPTDQGILAALEHLLAVYLSPRLDELPPLHGGVMGYLGYDVVREVEHLPDVPTDDSHLPDAALGVIGQLAAFDHFRQRVTLIENVVVAEGATTEDLDRAYDAAVERLDDLARDGARPIDEPLVEPPRPDEPLPDVTSSMGRPGSARLSR